MVKGVAKAIPFIVLKEDFPASIHNADMNTITDEI